eukprot:754506-Hanusia_phi.AAC.4
MRLQAESSSSAPYTFLFSHLPLFPLSSLLIRLLQNILTNTDRFSFLGPPEGQQEDGGTGRPTGTAAERSPPSLPIPPFLPLTACASDAGQARALLTLSVSRPGLAARLSDAPPLQYDYHGPACAFPRDV